MRLVHPTFPASIFLGFIFLVGLWAVVAVGDLNDVTTIFAVGSCWKLTYSANQSSYQVELNRIKTTKPTVSSLKPGKILGPSFEIVQKIDFIECVIYDKIDRSPCNRNLADRPA